MTTSEPVTPHPDDDRYTTGAATGTSGSAPANDVTGSPAEPEPAQDSEATEQDDPPFQTPDPAALQADHPDV